MEQSLPLSGDAVPRGVRRRQTFAAILWIVLPAILLSGGILLWFLIFNRLDLAVLSRINLISILLCESGGILLLLPIVSNRATKVALTTGCCWNILYAIYVGVSILVNLWDQFAFILVGLANCLAWSYCFSLILRNNRMDERFVSWVTLLIVAQIASFIPRVGDLFVQYGVGSLIITPSSLYSLFSLILNVLLIIALFKLVRSGAFSGDFDDAPAQEGAYSPLNKYMVGLFVTIVVVLAALWAYNTYAAPLLREL